MTDRKARDGAPAGRQRPPGDDAGSASSETPASAGARPGGRYTAPRRESARARQERVAGEVLVACGVMGDANLNDPLPF